MEQAATLPTTPEAVWPPGPTARQFIRMALMPGSTPISRFALLQKRYGNTFGFHLRGRHFAMFIGADANQYILGAHAGNFAQAAGFRLGSVLGNGLLTSDGAFHDRQRRLVSPAFHRGRIEAYQATMVEETARLLDTWRVGQRLDFSAAMHDLTLTIAGRTLFSIDLLHEARDFGQAITTVINSLRVRPISLRNIRRDIPGLPYHRALKSGAYLDAFVYRLIAERRAAGTDTGDVLSMLLAARDEEGMAMDDRQLRDEVMTLISAGHETTANALGWTFLLLAQNPAVRARLIEEIDGVLGDRPPTPADLGRLVYLDCVIKESLRLYPPAWAGIRIARDAIDVRGYHLPAGTAIGFTQYFTHRMPEYYADPERFLPERFHPEHGESHPPYAYIPFGMGPRSCIGSGFALMELKALVPFILQRYRPELLPGQRIVLEPIVTLRPKKGIRMRLAASPLTAGT
jgi:cytochrome P450